MISSRRMIGYCTHPGCEHQKKGVLLPTLDEAFICPRCERRGQLEWERGVISGYSDVFSEVRVEFDFDPAKGCYLQVFRIRDESMLREQSVYTLQSPLIRTRRYAKSVAEVLLRNLAEGGPAIDENDPRRGYRRSAATAATAPV